MNNPTLFSKQKQELNHLRNELETNYTWQSLRKTSKQFGEQIVEYRKIRINQIANRMTELHEQLGDFK